MDYVLKVSPKGQVTLPKKLRQWLDVKDFVEIDVRNSESILKKPDISAEKLAGCFRRYASIGKIPIENAVNMIRNIVAHEIAKKNN